MFWQPDNDPHHMHPDPNLIYYFFILAVITAAAALYIGWKVMIFLDNRYERKKRAEKDSELKTGSESETSTEREGESQ